MQNKQNKQNKSVDVMAANLKPRNMQILTDLKETTDLSLIILVLTSLFSFSSHSAFKEPLNCHLRADAATHHSALTCYNVAI